MNNKKIEVSREILKTIKKHFSLIQKIRDTKLQFNKRVDCNIELKKLLESIDNNFLVIYQDTNQQYKYLNPKTELNYATELKQYSSKKIDLTYRELKPKLKFLTEY